MHAVIQTPDFQKHAKGYGVTEDELQEIVELIAENPTSGEIMPGTGGARKLRVGRPGKGKRGGFRVITFFAGEDVPVFLLDIFAKNEKVNLSHAERNELRTILADIATEYRQSTAQLSKRHQVIRFAR